MIETPTEAPTDMLGFVYKTTRLTDSKFYIGKKKFWFSHTKKPLKGKKLKRHSLKESDWKTYYGSSKDLVADMEKLGTEQFSREILHICRTASELAYMELMEQLKHNVLDPETHSYNGILNIRIPIKRQKK